MTHQLMALCRPILVGVGLFLALAAVTLNNLEHEVAVDSARADLLAMTTGAVRGTAKEADVQLHLDAASDAAWTTVDGKITAFIDFAGRTVDLEATPSRRSVCLRGPIHPHRTCQLPDGPVIVGFRAGGEQGTVRVPVHSAGEER